jgi:hypothetical protein
MFRPAQDLKVLWTSLSMWQSLSLLFHQTQDTTPHPSASRLAGEAVDTPEHREGLAMLQVNHRIYFFPFVTSPGNRVSTMVTWPLIFLNQ